MGQNNPSHNTQQMCSYVPAHERLEVCQQNHVSWGTFIFNKLEKSSHKIKTNKKTFLYEMCKYFIPVSETDMKVLLINFDLFFKPDHLNGVN